MATVKASLKTAKEELARGEHKAALQHCKAALKADKNSYDAYLLIGKAAFLLGEHAQAALAYNKATELNPEAQPAWKGLVELYTSTKETESLTDALEHLVKLSSKDGLERLIPLQMRLVSLYVSSERQADAISLLQSICQRLDQANPAFLAAHCQLADLQLATSVQSSLMSVIETIVKYSSPDPSHERYHGLWLQDQFSKLLKYSESSQEWLLSRESLMEQCLQMLGLPHQAVTARSQPTCCCSTPSELVLKIGDQIAHAGVKSEGSLSHDIEKRLVKKMAHSFPWTCRSRVHTALLKHKIVCNNSTCPSLLKDRQRLLMVLKPESLLKAGLGAAWQVAAELHLQNDDRKACLEILRQGLDFLEGEEKAGHPPQLQVKIRLQLLEASSLLQKGQQEEAGAKFKALAESCKSMRDSVLVAYVRRKSLMGLAACSLVKPDHKAAVTICKRLLADSSLPTSDRAATLSTQGWAHFESGNLEEARTSFEAAVAASISSGGHCTDADLGERHLRLGRILWSIGGRFKEDRTFAHKQWLHCAALWGPAQGSGFAWLGTYYIEVAQDTARAQKCFQRALSLDPLQRAAGQRLCQLLLEDGLAEKALELCQSTTARAEGASWAWSLAGRLHLKRQQYTQAVQALQSGLKRDVKDADAWEALGCAYQSLGRLTAAIKAYSRATALDPCRWYSWAQSGSMQLSLGLSQEALASFQEALREQPGNLAALLGSGEACLQLARRRIHQGALGTASEDLQTAEEWAVQACSQAGNIRAAWKLLGDVRLAHHVLEPCVDSPAAFTYLRDSSAHESLALWGGRMEEVASAKSAYCKALHLAPHVGCGWGDAALAEWRHLQLKSAHTALPDSSERLQSNAERLVRGGICLEPGNPSLWLGLGSCSSSTAAKEYAFSRALQLEPKLVPAWCALGRLYAEKGETTLAGRCYTNARSHEPTAASVWEGMGALAGLSPTGANDKLDYYLHATTLGAGTEALLGFVEAALSNGQGQEAQTFAAACRSVALSPLSPAAHNAKGLVEECRGDYASAAKHLQKAMALLELQAKTPGSKDPSLLCSSSSIEGRTSHQDLSTAAKINLGRILVKDERFSEAITIFDQLDFMQSLEGKPAALLAYAQALAGAGDATAQSTFATALEAAPEAETYAEIIEALLQWHVSNQDIKAAVQEMDQQMPRLLQQKCPSATIEGLMLCLLAGAAKFGSAGEVASVKEMCGRFCQCSNDTDEAAFVAAQLSVLSICKRLDSKATSKVASLAGHAVHTCPWEKSLLSKLASAALMHFPLKASSAGSIARYLCQTAISRPHLHEEDWDQLCILLGVAALLMPAAGTSGLDDLRMLKKWLHTQPHQPQAWLFTGLLSLHSALAAQSARGLLSAQRLLTLAAAVCSRGSFEQEKALLLVALSDCHMHLALDGDKEEHCKLSQAALDKAAESSGRSSIITQTIMMQRARLQVLAENWKEAEQLLLEVLGSGKSKESRQQAFATQTALGIPPTSRSEALKAHISDSAQGMPAFQAIMQSLQALKEGDLPGAVAAATSAVSQLSATAAMDMPSILHKQAAHLLEGLARLELASHENSAAGISEAKACLTKATAGPQSNATVLAVLMLADAESLGTKKNKAERIDQLLQQVNLKILPPHTMKWVSRFAVGS